MVSTSDFESGDPSSSLGRTLISTFTRIVVFEEIFAWLNNLGLIISSHYLIQSKSTFPFKYWNAEKFIFN